MLKIKDNVDLKELEKFRFKPGQAVMYKPKNHKGEVYKEEPGIVKRMRMDGKVAFVWYHEGCTAAATPIEYLEESHITIAHTKIHHGCEECETKCDNNAIKNTHKNKEREKRI